MLPMPNKFGIKIKIHRLKAGLSRKQLSQYFKGDPSRKSIFHWENGFYKPDRKHLAVMQTFLKLDVQAILLRAKSLSIKPSKEMRANHGRKKQEVKHGTDNNIERTQRPLQDSGH